ncbi:MAG: glutamine--fructose-6-phosphate transaminase (isomerizing) [Myxococcota bacterium]
MCGIIGYIGRQPAQPILLEGLRRLEYRGYDSAGIATWDEQRRRTCIRRTVGKVDRLHRLVQQKPCSGVVGIGHTRWATHGRPTASNAHPHRSGCISLVHNGIVDNYNFLKGQLAIDVGLSKSLLAEESDSAVLARHVAWAKHEHREIEKAVPRALAQVQGTFALAILDADAPEKLICARRSSPLVVGLGEEEMYVASDIWALLSRTRRFMVLQDGDMAIVTAQGVRVLDEQGEQKQRPVHVIDDVDAQNDKKGHKYFMHKEIHEQPTVVKRVLQRGCAPLLFPHKVPSEPLRGTPVATSGAPRNVPISPELLVANPPRGVVHELAQADRIVVAACGTSLYAALMGEYWIEQLAGVPVEVELASEFRHRRFLTTPQTALIAVSRSGETADTVGALHAARQVGVSRILALCDTPHSSLTRLCDRHLGTLYTHAGVEIGVASSKAFLAQALSFYLLALALGQRRGVLTQTCVRSHLQQLAYLPQVITAVLAQQEAIRGIAQEQLRTQGMLFIGRGIFYPLALEGALKMKELAYVHAHGYAAGEMKHGPIALVDDKLPVVALMALGEHRNKLLANVREAQARGGRILAVGWERDEDLFDLAQWSIRLPCPVELTCPFAAAVALQLLAYHVADGKGMDVDQPRNLAKSVTVE